MIDWSEKLSRFNRQERSRFRDENDLVITLYWGKLLTLAAIGEKLEVDQETVRAVLRRNGVERRPPGRQHLWKYKRRG